MGCTVISAFGSLRCCSWRRSTHLCDFVLGDGLKVWRGESEPAVSSRIVWEKLQRHIVFPLVAIAQINSVHADKPVWTWNDTHDKRQLQMEEVEHGEEDGA